MARWGSRAALVRFAAPAAFLAAATIAVLLVRAGLHGESSIAPTAPLPTVRTVATAPTTTATETRERRGQYYVVQRGDTLDQIATRFDTTVEQLLLLNPGVEPTSLRIGQKLRVA